MDKDKLGHSKAVELVSKADAIMEHCQRQMLGIEYNTQLLEGAFIELKKQASESPLKQAHSAVIRCVVDSVIIAIHAACFDKTKGKKKSPSLSRIMRGKKASFCDAVYLLDGKSKASKAAANLITKHRVALGAKWRNWKPYICFKEDEIEREEPFPVFPGEDSFTQRIATQKRHQADSIASWRKIGSLPAFKRFKATRDRLKAHHNMDMQSNEYISTFADVIEVSKKCADAIAVVCLVHFGRRISSDSKAGRMAYEKLANPSCKSCGCPIK